MVEIRKLASSVTSELPLARACFVCFLRLNTASYNTTMLSSRALHMSLATTTGFTFRRNMNIRS